MRITETQAKEKVEEGELRVLITFEMAGKPKEHVEQTLKTFTDKLIEDPAVGCVNEHTEEAIETEEEGIFSAFSEIELTIGTLEALTHLNVNLMPASIEILEPDEFTFSARELMNWQNDLLSQLHSISHQVREVRQKHAHLAKNMQALLRNTITILLLNGPKEEDSLHRLTGVPKETIHHVLEELSKEDIITEKEGVWEHNKK